MNNSKVGCSKSKKKLKMNKDLTEDKIALQF